MATNFDDMFGTVPREAANDAEMVEGFQAGVLYAASLQETVNTAFADRSRAYREGVLEGIRDAL